MGWGLLGRGGERRGGRGERGLRRDGVDADVLVAVIGCGGLGQAYDGVLGKKREVC